MSWYSSRKNPKIYEWSYLGRIGIKKAIQSFVKEYVGDKKNYVLVDLGCADGPYKNMFKHYNEYIGVDVFQHSNVTLVANMWDTKIPSGSVDFLLATEVLEHSEKYKETIQEIKRILKPEGKAFLSIPFLYPMHGGDDRWRFTQNGLKDIFGEKAIILPSNSFFVTWGQLFTILWAMIPLGRFLYPLFVLVNLFSILGDWGLESFCKVLKIGFNEKNYIKIKENILESFPMRYFVILSK